MRRTLLSAAVASAVIATLFLAPEANAVEGLSANVGITSNYLWRGMTQTNDAAAVSGGIDYGHDSGFYAGTWTSNVDFGDSASHEIDFYFGFGGDIGHSGLGYDLGYIYYAYPDSAEVDSTNEVDFGEVHATLSYSLFSFTANYVVNNDDNAAWLDSALYLSADVAFEIAEDLELGFHIGDYSYDDEFSANDYTDIAISLSKDNFTLTLSDTDMEMMGKSVDDVKVVISYSMDIDL